MHTRIIPTVLFNHSKSTKRIRDFKRNPHPLAPYPKALGKGKKEAYAARNSLKVYKDLLFKKKN
jgi:hypothetical protein